MGSLQKNCIDRELLERIIHKRGRFELLSVLFADMLLARGVDVRYLSEASKDEIAHELIRVRKKTYESRTP